jgi:hypothetical protein
MSGFVRRNVKVGPAAGAILIGLLSVPGNTLAQSLKDQIVGAWRQVSVYNDVAGVKKHIYGEKPVGLVVFDRSGYVISFLAKPDLPKFAANNRLKGTDEEYRSVMQGMISGFGTYTIDGDAVVINWIASSYPNRAGTMEKRTYKIVGDEMTAINPTASSGGTSYQKWVRAK